MILVRHLLHNLPKQLKQPGIVVHAQVAQSRPLQTIFQSRRQQAIRLLRNTSLMQRS
jgi:hypothetical protein